MNRFLVVASLLTCTLLVPGCGGKKAREARLPEVVEHAPRVEENTIVIEAENATSLEPPVKVVEHEDASGGKCIRIEGGAGKPNTTNSATGVTYPARYGAAVYKFDVKKTGKYKLWGRKFWEDGCGNSFTLVMNGGPELLFGGDGTYECWEWKAAPVLFDLPTGENTLEVLNREDGVKLDKVILTPDLDFIPQGKE